MKKIFLGILILIVLIIIGLAVFIATFDLNHLKPEVIRQLEQATGKPVELGRIALSWHQGLAISAKDLVIYESETNRQIPLLRLESANAVLNLKPLLRREIQIASVILSHPVVTIRATEPQAAATTPAAHTSVTTTTPNLPSANTQEQLSQTAGIAFLAETFQIENGEFYYQDSYGKTPMNIALQNIDVELKGVTFNQPIPVKIQASFLSSEQNLNLQGFVEVNPDTRQATASKIHFHTDLSTFNDRQLAQFIPSLSGSGVEAGFAGLLDARIETLPLNPEAIKNAVANVSLQNGEWPLPSLGASISQISGTLVAQNQSLQLTSLTAEAGGGKIVASGNWENWMQPFSTVHFQGTLVDLNVENLLQQQTQEKGAPSFRGYISGSLDVTGTSGPNHQDLMRSLQGGGQFILKEGVILNVNFLEELFNKLSLIPGVVPSLMRRLPEDYQEKIKQPHTYLGPVNVPFQINQGWLLVNHFQVQADSFDLAGNLRYGLGNEQLAIQAIAVVDAPLSEAMIKSVKELQYLANSQGRIEIPFFIQGAAGQISFSPDLSTIGTRLAVGKTQEMIGGLWQQKNTGTTRQDSSLPTSSGAPGTASSQADGSWQGLLGSFLQNAVAQKDQQ